MRKELGFQNPASSRLTRKRKRDKGEKKLPLQRTPALRTCCPRRWVGPMGPERRRRRRPAQPRTRIPRSRTGPALLLSWSNSAHLRLRRQRLCPRQGQRERNQLLQAGRRSTAQTRGAEALTGRGARNAGRIGLRCEEGRPRARAPGTSRLGMRRAPDLRGQQRCTDAGTRHAGTPTHKHWRNKDGPEPHMPARAARGAHRHPPS